MVIFVRSLHKCGGAITVGVKGVLFMALEGEVMRLVESSSPWIFDTRVYNSRTSSVVWFP